MTDAESKLHGAIMQFNLAANTEDEAMVRSCVSVMIDSGRSVTPIRQQGIGTVLALRRWYEIRPAELTWPQLFAAPYASSYGT